MSKLSVLKSDNKEACQAACEGALDSARDYEMAHVLIVVTDQEGEITYIEAGAGSVASTLGKIEIIKNTILNPAYEYH